MLDWDLLLILILYIVIPTFRGTGYHSQKGFELWRLFLSLQVAAPDPRTEFSSTARDTVPSWIRDEQAGLGINCGKCFQAHSCLLLKAGFSTLTDFNILPEVVDKGLGVMGCPICNQKAISL